MPVGRLLRRRGAGRKRAVRRGDLQRRLCVYLCGRTSASARAADGIDLSADSVRRADFHPEKGKAPRHGHRLVPRAVRDLALCD